MGRLAEFERRAGAATVALAELEARCVPAERVPEFRGELVELARAAGCQIRQIRALEPRLRPWMPGGDPLGDEAPLDRGEPGQLMLETSELVLTAAGGPEETRAFLERLGALGRLVDTRSLTVEVTDVDERQVVVELSVRMFALKLPAEAP